MLTLPSSIHVCVCFLLHTEERGTFAFFHDASQCCNHSQWAKPGAHRLCDSGECGPVSLHELCNGIAAQTHCREAIFRCWYERIVAHICSQFVSRIEHEFACFLRVLNRYELHRAAEQSPVEQRAIGERDEAKRSYVCFLAICCECCTQIAAG